MWDRAVIKFFLGPPIFVNFNFVCNCIFYHFPFFGTMNFFFFLILETVNFDHKITVFLNLKRIVYFYCKNSLSSTMKIIISFSRNSIIRLPNFLAGSFRKGKPLKLRKFPIIFVHEIDNASNDMAKKQLTLIIFHDNNSPLRDSSRFHRISC